MEVAVCCESVVLQPPVLFLWFAVVLQLRKKRCKCEPDGILRCSYVILLK